MMTIRHRALACVIAVGALLALVGVVPARAGGSLAPACSWPMYGHDAARSFATPAGCSSVSVVSAPALVPKWTYPTPDAVSASPTIVDGTVYVGDWTGSFYALPADPPSGAVQPKWTFKVDDTNGVAFGRIVSTAAYVTTAGRAVVVFAGGATLYALDAATGTRLASVCLDPRRDPAVRCRTPDTEAEIESSPVIVQRGDDVGVLVGIDVHNDRHIGRTGVVELELHPEGDGVAFEPVWKFDPEAGVAYTGDGLLTVGAGTGDGCGGVWSSPAVDTDDRLVFFGTASCSVDGVDTGEHMWAVSLDDGALVWSYGPPRTSTRFDDDFGASPNLLPGGLVGEGSKDGWYYALDRRSGPDGGPRLRWATQVGQPGHLTVDFAVGGILGSTATGTVHGEPAVFATTAIPTPLDRPLDDAAGPSLDPTLVTDPLRLLSLTAISAVDGRVLWRAPLSRSSYGAPSVVNGVVLVPSTFDFSIGAYAADTGLPLSTWPVAGPPASTPTAIGDSVYVGVGTSTGSSSPLAALSGVWALRVASP